MPTKKSSANEETIIAGISHSSKSAAFSDAQKALASGLNSIELTVAGNRKVIFEKVVIRHDHIMTKTVVPVENQRLQHLLNEVTCADILKTLATDGQQFPAIGQYLPDGTIETGDGSRRRWSCHFAQKDFVIYATKDTLSREDIKYLSEVGNVHKRISLYERGAQFQSLLDNKVYEKDADLALGEGVDKAIVSVALKAYALPRVFIDNLPSIDAFGRPAVNALSKLIAKADKKQRVAMEDAANAKSLHQWIDETGSRNANTLNGAYLESLNACVPVKKARTSKQNIIASKGKVKAAVTKQSKTGFELKIEHLPEDKKESLLARIKDMIEQG